jgi:ADP-ribosylglycohydrolase
MADVDLVRLRRLLSGLAVGDSLGSTSEFLPQTDIPALYEATREQGWPFRQVGAGAFNWKPGDPTDDTDMAMCMVRPFVRAEGHLHGDDVAREFVAWMRSNPPDIGVTTRGAINGLLGDTEWFNGGLESYRHNARAWANGSLMRNGVVAGMRCNPEATGRNSVFEYTVHHGLITHYAPLPQLCCLAQSWLILKLLEGDNPFNRNWLSELREDVEHFFNHTADGISRMWYANVRDDYEDAWMEMNRASFNCDQFNPFGISYKSRMGFCLLTLQIGVWAAQWAMRGAPFGVLPAEYPVEPFYQTGWGVIGWVAMIGNDSDTYGATAGALIAAALGEPPAEMQAGLQALIEFDKLVQA